MSSLSLFLFLYFSRQPYTLLLGQFQFMCFWLGERETGGEGEGRPPCLSPSSSTLKATRSSCSSSFAPIFRYYYYRCCYCYCYCMGRCFYAQALWFASLLLMTQIFLATSTPRRSINGESAIERYLFGAPAGAPIAPASRRIFGAPGGAPKRYFQYRFHHYC